MSILAAINVGELDACWDERDVQRKDAIHLEELLATQQETMAAADEYRLDLEEEVAFLEEAVSVFKCNTSQGCG